MNALPVLRILIGEFYQKLTSLNNLIQRDAQFPDAPNKIKVAIGMRRTGKTYFLYQHILQLIKSGIDKTRILYINFEDDRLLPLHTQKCAQLIEAFYSLYPENHDKKCYLFFDEIQNVEQWSTIIRRLHDSKNVELFLTGSSAKLLSKEISTNLRGRSLATEIWPYSFEEFIRAKNIVIDTSLYDRKTQDILTSLFHDYLSTGGFPEITHFPSDIAQQTLQDYLDIALYRDIIERHLVKHPTQMKHMILSMMHNIGKSFAVNKFYNELKSHGYPIGKDLLYEYAEHIEDAYLIFPTSIYTPSLRKMQTNPKKTYAIDPGMVRALTLDYETNLGRLFENIIYLDLRRQGYNVHYYLTSERYEIDFLVQTPRGEKQLIQVAWDISDPQTLAREERALQAGMKELKVKGQIITLNTYLEKGSLLYQF